MSVLLSLILLIVFLLAGYILARLRVLSFSPLFERLFTYTLYLLLLSMGIRLGQSREVLSELGRIGLLSLVTAVSTCLGTVLLHVAAAPLYKKLDSHSTVNITGRTGRSESKARRVVENLTMPGILLFLVLVGVAIGFALPSISALKDGSVSSFILYGLLFIIGLQMASIQNRLASLLLRPSVLIIPLITIAGSLLGSLSTLAFPDMTVGRSLALGAGFGWYSLSGVLITDMGEPVLGAAAFLANIFRETIAFLCVPLLVHTKRTESGVGICGATSMDVTLPMLEDSWGPDIVPVAVAHGVFLSFLVPFLVPLCMAF